MLSQLHHFFAIKHEYSHYIELKINISSGQVLPSHKLRSGQVLLSNESLKA